MVEGIGGNLIRFLQDKLLTTPVLDLPQLYSKPSASTILSTLSDLKSQPPSWETTPISGNSRVGSGTSTPARKARKIRNQGVPGYLTKIVSSSLQWIEDEDEKEQIWETASQELSARSGRTAVGDLTRSFIIPTSGAVQHGDGQLQDVDEWIELKIHEPALTADNLGFKTWASSYLLAKRLPLLKTSPTLTGDILELGSGTGLVGMAAACIYEALVVATDLPDIVPNLEHNIHGNTSIIHGHGGSMSAAVLDWSTPEILMVCGEQRPMRSFQTIMAADVAYSAEQPVLLAKTITYHLKREQAARFVMEIPVRPGFDKEVADVRHHFDKIGLVVETEGEETGLDDWSTQDDDNQAEVRCWWSVWQWRVK